MYKRQVTHSLKFSVAGNTCNNGLTGIFLETVSDGSATQNVVNHCKTGVHINRIHGEPKSIVVEDNLFDDCVVGCAITGDMKEIHITKNRFTSIRKFAFQFGAGNGNVSGVSFGDNLVALTTTAEAVVRITGSRAQQLLGNGNQLDRGSNVSAPLLLNGAAQTLNVRGF